MNPENALRLREAAEHNDVFQLQKLLATIPLPISDDSRRTLESVLCRAASYGALDSIRCFFELFQFEASMQLHLQQEAVLRAFESAAVNGHKAVVQYFIEDAWKFDSQRRHLDLLHNHGQLLHSITKASDTLHILKYLFEDAWKRSPQPVPLNPYRTTQFDIRHLCTYGQSYENIRYVVETAWKQIPDFKPADGRGIQLAYDPNPLLSATIHGEKYGNPKAKLVEYLLVAGASFSKLPMDSSISPTIYGMSARTLQFLAAGIYAGEIEPVNGKIRTGDILAYLKRFDLPPKIDLHACFLKFESAEQKKTLTKKKKAFLTQNPAFILAVQQGFIQSFEDITRFFAAPAKAVSCQRL